jgi:hypothetical protein
MRIDSSQILVIVGVLGFFASLAATWALAVPQSRLSPLSGLAAASEVRAHLLSAPVEASPEALAEAATETRASLRQSPANATAWLRLAYIDSRNDGGLGSDGNLALARSYGVAPLGPDDTFWRLAFAFNNWTALERVNRMSALEELRWAQRSRRVNIRKLLASVTDPAGRLALDLTLDVGRAQNDRG